MIELKNQLKIRFDLEGYSDFIIEEDFNNLVIIEEAGNLLPTYKLTFTLSDPKLLPYLNEGATIKFSFGTTERDMKDCPLRILKKGIQKAGNYKYIITLLGVYDAIGYITDCKIRDFSSKSGVQVVNEVVSTYFKPVFNISSSDDSQTWLQYNIPDKKFVNEVWMHSYIDQSFIGVGITVEGEFILKDIIQETKNKSANPDWRFVNGQQVQDNDIIYQGDYIVNSETGFINQWVGYGRKRQVRTIEVPVDSIVELEPSPLISMSNKLDRASDSGTRTAQFGVINDNVHENWYKAYQQNLTNLALFGSTKIGLSFELGMMPIKILDLVMFKDNEVQTKSRIDNYSGLYFITKVSRTISSRMISTVVELNREVLGDIRADKLK